MKITDSCYVVSGLYSIPPWMVNAGFIVGKEKTLIIDSGLCYLSAQTIYGYSKAVNPTNQIILINTEPHSDHMGGNSFFHEKGVQIYGHPLINRSNTEFREIFEDHNNSIIYPGSKERNEEKYIFLKTKFVNPTFKIENEMSIDLGGLNIKVLLTPGHTPMNISIYCEEEGVLFAGDTIINGYLPNTGDLKKNDLENWIESALKLKKLSFKTLVPGHGDILQNDQIENEINNHINIFKNLLKNNFN